MQYTHTQLTHSCLKLCDWYAFKSHPHFLLWLDKKYKEFINILKPTQISIFPYPPFTAPLFITISKVRMTHYNQRLDRCCLLIIARSNSECKNRHMRMRWCCCCRLEHVKLFHNHCAYLPFCHMLRFISDLYTNAGKKWLLIQVFNNFTISCNYSQ